MWPASELVVPAEIDRRREEARKHLVTRRVIRETRSIRRRNRRLGHRLPQPRKASTAR